MKKVIFTLFISLITSSMAFSADGNEFSVDRKKISKEMNSLNELETYVNNHEGVTAEEIKSEALANSEMKSLAAILDDGPPLGIPSFWWGFGAACIGGAGYYGACWMGVAAVAFVYFMTDENKDEAKKAALGCVIGTVVGLAIGFLLWWVVLGRGFYGVY